MVAMPLPTMSNAVPCAGVVNTVSSPPVTVTPRLKPFSLVAIWPWSWYIVSTPSNLAAEGLEEHGVGGEGSLAGDAARRGLRHGRRDDLDLLAPEEPVLAAVRIERATAMRGAVESRAAHGAHRRA